MLGSQQDGRAAADRLTAAKMGQASREVDDAASIDSNAGLLHSTRPQSSVLADRPSMIAAWNVARCQRGNGTCRLWVGGVPRVLALLEGRAVVLAVLAARRSVHDEHDAHAILLGQCHYRVDLMRTRKWL